MKPLELTIFPPAPPCPRPSDAGYAYEDWHSRRVDEWALAIPKRLEDAELAAEYHAWDAHLKHLQWCELSSGDELSEESWRKLNARLETLWWFANLPHYDEVQS